MVNQMMAGVDYRKLVVWVVVNLDVWYCIVLYCIIFLYVVLKCKRRREAFQPSGWLR